MINDILSAYMKFLSELRSEGTIHDFKIYQQDKDGTIHVFVSEPEPIQKIELSEAAKNKIQEWCDEEIKKV